MKRSLWSAETLLTASSTALIAAAYGLVRLGYGLVLPDAQATLGLTSAAAGLVGSLGSLAYCVALLAGIGTVLAHPARVVVASGLCGAIGSLGIALAPTAGLFGCAAVLASASAGLASPATMHLIAERVAPGRRGQAQGVVNAGTGPGLLCAGALAVLLAPQWRAAWATIAVLTALAAVATVWAARRAARPSAPGSRPGSASWSAPWRDRRLYPVYLAAALLGTGSTAVWTYGRTQLESAWDMSPAASMTAWMALGAGALVSVLTARIQATWSVRAAWVISATSTAVATAALAVPGPSMWVPLLSCLLFGWGFTSATTALVHWGSAISEVGTGQSGPAAFVALAAGQSVGAAAIGVALAGVGLGTIILCAAAVTGAGTALVLRSPRRTRRGAAPGSGAAPRNYRVISSG
jgi:predicted MFS family arabinose efflux permease